MDYIQLIAEQLSINKQLDLLTSDIDINSRDWSSVYTVHIRPKPRSIYLDVETSGKYIYDKEKNVVYTIQGYGKKDRIVGSPKETYQKLVEQNSNLVNSFNKRKGMLPKLKQPIVKLERKLDVPNAVLGDVFHATWGYGMIINEFVMVVSDKPKTVDVVKLKKNQLGVAPYYQQGTEVPVLPPSNVIKTLPRFQLKKVIREDGSFYLKGSDKSKEFDTVFSWFLWDGKPVTYDTMD